MPDHEGPLEGIEPFAAVELNLPETGARCLSEWRDEAAPAPFPPGAYHGGAVDVYTTRHAMRPHNVDHAPTVTAPNRRRVSPPCSAGRVRRPRARHRRVRRAAARRASGVRSGSDPGGSEPPGDSPAHRLVVA